MSLKIWITGNGNVENQGCGLLDNPFISSPVYDSGKLGKCIKLTNIRSNLISLLDEPTSMTFSASYWVRLDSSSYDDWADIFGLRFVTGDGTVGEFREELHVADSTLYTNFFGPPLAGSDVSITNDSSNQITVGEWVHDTITCDGSILRWYRNDKEIRKYTIASNIKGSVNWQGIHVGSPAAQMSMCDFRLYDHCLSKKEIHEIYKSLILHYPLNNPFGNPNLLHGTKDWSNGRGGTFSTFATIDGEYRGFDVVKITAPVTSNAGELVDATHFTTTVEANTTYTLSFYYKGPEFSTFLYPNACKYARNNEGYVNNNALDGRLVFSASDIWEKCVCTWTTLDTLDSNTKHILPVRIYRSTSSVQIGYICGIKFEKGDTATPWCPNSADEEYSLLGLDSNIITDCSGYGNDGVTTINSYAHSSPRYNSSSWLGAADYIDCHQGATVSDEITVTMWCYKDDWKNGCTTIVSCREAGGWSITKLGSSDMQYMVQIRLNAAYSYAVISPTLSNIPGGWHMLSFTYDGLNLKSYFDGELFTTTSISTTDKVPIDYYRSNCILIHGESGDNTHELEYANDSAMMYSDFRIYATALTAEDIKELYQTPFSIDKNGNVFGYNFMEV